MQFSASQIALLINGKIEGDVNASVNSFGKIEEAQAGQLAFLANPKYEDHLYSTKASVIIISRALALKEPLSASIIRVPDPYSAFALLLEKYQQIKTQQLTGREEPVYIHPSASIGENVYIGAFVYIGENTRIADGVKIYPNTYIGNNVQIGADTIIHAGVKIYHETIIGAHV